jgi:RHH-type rel operon transcriptional repressor/antitoxin RelB
MTMLAVRLPKNLEARLEHLSQQSERSKSYYVKKALEKFLDEEEERQIALKAYEAYVKSGKKFHSFEDVMKENGL